MPDDEHTQKGHDDDTDPEVLSFDMTERDSGDDTDSDASPADEPHLTPTDPDAGFDGWLDDGGGDSPPDAYQELAEGDDVSAEVGDWVAFARGEPDDAAEVADEIEETEEDEEIPDEDIPDDEIPGDDEGGAIDDTSEFAIPRLEDDEDEEDGDDDTGGDDVDDNHDVDDTGEIPIVGEGNEFTIEDVDEDTGDIPVVAGMGAGFDAGTEMLVDLADGDKPDTVGDLADTAGADEPEGDVAVESEGRADGGPGDDDSDDHEDDADEDDEPSIDDFTEATYLGAATQEHVDLAAAILAADAGDTEQVALSAEIRGLESGVVGFEDVVEGTKGDEEPVAPPASTDLVLRVGTGLALIAALALSLLWRPALIVFVLAVFVVAAGEFYSALIHRKYKPLSLFGFLGIVGAALGTAAWGVAAIPIALLLMAIVLLLFSAVSPRRDQPAANFALTVLVAAWIGGLGAFAFDIIQAQDYQVLVLAIVFLVALVDISSFFVGRSIGRRPLAPVISPKKTVEGFVAGTLTALAVGAVIGYLVEPIDLPTGLVLGGVVAVFAPIGDLAVSVVKRSLDIKDMGSILPGHGGLLDRIDGVILAIPAVWVVMTWLAVI